MAHWLSSVNNLLEKLDDQVENVRDALTEQRDSDEDEEDYYSSEEEEDVDDVDNDDEDEEEEEIDLMGEKEEQSKPALFASNPLSEEMVPTKAADHDSTMSTQQADPTAKDTTTHSEEAPKPKDILASPPQPKEPQPAPPKSAFAAKGPPETVASKQTEKPTIPGSPPTKPSVPPPSPAAGTPENYKGKAKVEVTSGSKPSEESCESKPSKSKVGPLPSSAIQSSPMKKTMQAKPPANSSRGQAQQPAPSPQRQPQPQQNKPSKQKSQQPPIGKGTRPSLATSPPGRAGGLNTNNKQQVLAELDRLTKQVATLQQDLSSAQVQIKSQQKEYSSVVQSKQQLLSEMKPMRKQIVNLQQELNSANKEINAQRKELDSAATIVERERLELKEEKEDMQEDHEEEMDNLKADYEEKITNLKAKHKQQLDDMKQQLSQEKAERRQEGGDLNQDLEEALQREREALQELSNLKEEKASLETKAEKLTMQQESLQEKLESALQSQTAATEGQLRAETALDDALEQHKRQLKQRQVREAELERTIAEMGTALTTSSSVAPAPGAGTTAIESAGKKNDEKAANYKEQWELVTEELETLKGQLNLETQRSEALRRELGEINEERTQEATASQERQRQHDRKMEEQLAIISCLESNLRELQPNQDVAISSNGGSGAVESNAAVVQGLQRQLEESRDHMKRISEQLLRQQGMTDVHKSEILALKGRLQAANARAEEAEKTAFQSPAGNNGMSRLYDADGGGGVGGYKMRRRVKGRGGLGGAGGRSVTVRSIRTALNMGPGTSMENMGKTIDAIDSWMIETGAILRHEPIARLGFFLYFSILHLWCFCLVAFHVSDPSSGSGRSGPSSLRGATAINAASSGR